MTTLLLDIPGLHLAYLGCFGNDWVATPNLDRLASQSVLFDAHLASMPGDLSAGLTRLTQAGAAVSHLAADDAAAPLQERIRGVLQGIVSKLKKKPGPQHLVWAELPSLFPPWTLPAGMLDAYFDETEADSATLSPWPDPPAKLPAGDEHVDRLQFTYAAVVTHVDAQIGWLIEKITRGGSLDDLLLLITSSQGLPLGEHGWVGRQRAWQHEESVHLPLLMRLPGATEAGLRIAALTQPADLVPTLIEHLQKKRNGSAGPPTNGQSLWPLIRQDVGELRPHVCSADCIGASEEWALRTREWAYLLPLTVPDGDGQRLPQLYVKPDDRWEVNDVHAHHPELVEQMDRTLRECIESRRLR